MKWWKQKYGSKTLMDDEYLLRIIIMYTREREAVNYCFPVSQSLQRKRTSNLEVGLAKGKKKEK